MFSLSYLPTAERLTVVVVKARSLRIPSLDKVSASADLQNVFVKVRKYKNKSFPSINYLFYPFFNRCIC